MQQQTSPRVDRVESTYLKVRGFFRDLSDLSVPYFRRFLRFIALPYCYVKLVNWSECRASRIRVARDFVYIFFKLKYFPDNYSPCRLWEKDRREWHDYYGSIYEPYQRYRLERHVQPREYRIIFTDKFVCYQLCQASGLPLPEQYGVIEPGAEALEILHDLIMRQPEKKIIVKPSNGRDGRGIVLAYQDGGEAIVETKTGKMPLRQFLLAERSVMQELLEPHRDLSAVSSSICSVRIVTLLTSEREVVIVGAQMRLSVGDTYTDGAIGIGIDVAKGVFMEKGFDRSGRFYLRHPDTGTTFKDFEVPFWEDVVDLAREIQERFFFYRLLGNDILITHEGPVVLEINGTHDNVLLEQRYGPILADSRVRREFERYDLLLN